VLTYWHDTDPEPDRKELALLDEQVRRLQKLGITIKGHPLILAGAFPKWAPSDPDRIRTLTQRHIKDLATRYRGKIDVWDVVGDATTASGAQNGLGAWARKAGPARFTADALEWARAASPKAVLLYNDYKLDADYLKLIRDVQDLGAPLDALGLEAHMVGSEWPMEKLWETAETFDHLAKPLHFSEITVLSDDPKADHAKAWPSTPEGEARQADYVEKLYTLLFSHPAVKAIAWWNFVDGDWDRMPGGLLRADLTPKPAYARLRQLINERWRTTADLSTDMFGGATVRGFAGSYRISVRTDSGEVTADEIVKSGQRNNITVRVR
jgi:endo-1,4-beta-xylanase